MRHSLRYSRLRLRPTILASALVAGSLLAACGGADAVAAPDEENVPNQGIVAGTLEARAARPTVTLRNTTEFVVGYMIIDKDQATVALFPPCNQSCPLLRQGESVAVPYTAISGYTSSSREAIVMWWKYTRSADGTLRPTGAVQTTKLSLD